MSHAIDENNPSSCEMPDFTDRLEGVHTLCVSLLCLNMAHRHHGDYSKDPYEWIIEVMGITIEGRAHKDCVEEVYFYGCENVPVNLPWFMHIEEPTGATE